MRRLILAFLLAASPLLAVNVLFSDDAERTIMETYVQNGWTINNAGVASSSAQVHSGLYSYVATATGADKSAYIAYTAGSYDPVYLKAWIYVPTAYTLASGSTVNILGLAQIPGSYASYSIYLKNTSGTFNLYVGTTTGTHAVSRDAWHAIEMAYNVAAGTVAVTLDGTADISLSGLTLESKNNVVIGAKAGTGDIYFDDITVSDTASGNPTSNVAIRHAYPGNRISMKIQTYIWGAAGTDSLVSSIDGTPFSTIANPGMYQAPVLTVSTLSAGNHTLLVALKDSGGSTRSSATETIASSGAVPLAGLDQNNNFVVGGHKVFPISGWFTQGASALNWFNAGYTNSEGWASEYSTSYSQSQFSSYIHGADLNCAANGIPVIGPLNTRINTANGSNCGTSGGTTCATDYAAYASAMSTDACMLAWSGFDEASVNGWTVPQMLGAVSGVHANDNNHPIIYDDASIPYLGLTRYYPTLLADVYSSDNYPLCYHNLFASQGKNVASWVSMLDRDTRANYGLVPDLVVLELYKFYASPSGFDCTNVTGTTVYNQAWLSVIHGRKGISWYDNGSENSTGYGPACANGTSVDCFPANPSTHIGKFTGQIASITPDSVLAGPGTRTVTSNRTTPGSRVDVLVTDDGVHTWVFAARLTDIIADPSEATAAPLSTTITVAGLTSGTVTVYDESRTLSISGGAITDSFDPYGVHIYEYDDAPVPNRIISGQSIRTGASQ